MEKWMLAGAPKIYIAYYETGLLLYRGGEVFLPEGCSSQLLHSWVSWRNRSRLFYLPVCLSDFSVGTCEVLMPLTQMSSRVNNLLDRWFMRTTVRLKERIKTFEERSKEQTPQLQCKHLLKFVTFLQLGVSFTHSCLLHAPKWLSLRLFIPHEPECHQQREGCLYYF